MFYEEVLEEVKVVRRECGEKGMIRRKS